MMSALLRSLRSAFKTRRGLAFENLALGQQLAVTPAIGETAAALAGGPLVLGALAETLD